MEKLKKNKQNNNNNIINTISDDEQEIIIHESDILKDEIFTSFDKKRKIDMENPKDFLSAESKTKILYQNLKKIWDFLLLLH